MPRLRQVEAALRKSCGTTDCGTQKQEKEQELVTRCYVDTGPIVERVAAKYAGIGWFGKNTCIINQKDWIVDFPRGDSYVARFPDRRFRDQRIGEVALLPATHGFGVPAPDRCGSCTRCIDACPTDALIAPYQLDSNKCIAYLTIEKRGPDS